MHRCALQQRPHFGMSACCSLDEPGSLPSLNTHPSSSPPNRPGLLGRTPATKAHNNAGVHQPRRTPRTLQPPRSSSDGVPAAARRTRGPEECSPRRRARLPHQRACTGDSRLWFPILRLAFQKLSSSCGNFCGRRWVRTTGFSLVRRKQLTTRSSSQTRFHALDLRKPWPEMPRDAWESLHGGSRKWFPEQHRRSGDNSA